MDRIKILQSQLVMVTGFAVFAIVFKSWPLLYFVTGLGVVFVFVPSLGHYISLGWFKLAELLGWINSRILLSVIFFFFLFPLSIFQRMFSKDPLALKGGKSKTLFTERNHKYTAADLEKGW